ncbi:MAG: alpha/beta fold hydrolase [Sarcina sp.]
MQKITLNNNRTISYKREGNLLGETIVFVHSFLWDKDMWKEQVEKLKGEYDCITIDLCGHGDSDINNNSFTLRDLANDVLDVIDELGILYFHYIGLSAGGMLTPYINDMCNRVESFIIMDSYCGIEPTNKKELYLSLINKIEKQGKIQLDDAKIIAPMFFSSQDVENVNILSDIFANKIVNIPQTNIQTICNMGRAIFERENALDLLEKISVKTSFIVGEFDIARPKHESEEMSKLLPNSHVFVVENAGHISNIENPQRVNQILTRLFDVDDCSEKRNHFFI